MRVSYRSLVALLAVCVCCCMKEANALTKYVARSPTSSMSAGDKNYVIGVVSFVMVAIACIMGVASMAMINYDDDTLLMVEVPEDTKHDE